MKKYFYILAALSIAPIFAHAQTLESDVDAELDQMYSSAKAAPAQKVEAVQAPATTAATAQPVTATPMNLNGSQPIYILNQAPSNASAQVQQTQVQKQPTTVIEASPLTESRAEQIRKSRQDAEVQTEQKIVEKLEQSRMEDEKKRANVLFGDKLNSQPQQEIAPIQQQQIAPVVVVAPTPAPVVVAPIQKVEEPKENTRDIVRQEIAASKKAEDEEIKRPTEVKYVGGMIGVGDVPDANNVKGNYALGVSFGKKVDNFIIEGSFIYSNYTVSNQYSGYYNQYGGYGGYSPYSAGGYYTPNSVDVNQYSGSLAAKVQLFDGIIKPVFGGVMAYSYRTFGWNNSNMGYGYNNDTTASSHAIDVGALVGADLEFSPKYSIGLDFRYMFNLASRVNAPDNSWMTGPSYGTPIEKLQYYVMSLSGRVNF